MADADLWLSPRCRLLADSPTATDFVYDGAGHRLVLPEGLAEGEALPLILVGAGKSLALRNVRVVHAASLGACLQLGAGRGPLPAVPASPVLAEQLSTR